MSTGKMIIEVQDQNVSIKTEGVIPLSEIIVSMREFCEQISKQVGTPIEEVVEHFVKGLIDPSYLFQEDEEEE